MSFGKKIQELRRARRMTQRELAEELQVQGLRADFTYISKIENDRLKYPPSEELIRGLARILGGGADELLDLAAKFNQRALRKVAAEIPEVGVLLRRLQSGAVDRQKVRRILRDIE